MDRLDKLGMGLMRECRVIGEAEDLMHLVERRAYLRAIRDTIDGLGRAKVVLAKATMRHAEEMEGEG
jgi:hypothetical protein